MGGYAPAQRATVAAAAALTNQAPAPLPKAASELHNAYIERGTPCDVGARSPGCFLDHDQRSRLVNGYGIRVLAAQQAYHDALAEIRVDELIEKDDDQSWVVGFVVDVVAAYSITTLGGTLTRFLAGTADELLGDLAKSDAATRAKGTSSNGVEAIVRAVVGQAKDRAKKSANESPARSRAKANAVSYLEMLQTEASLTYQALGERPPGVLTDAELVVWYASFSVEQGHTIAVYKAELGAKLARFKASRIGDLGTRRADHIEPISEADRTAADGVRTRGEAMQFSMSHAASVRPAVRELKVAWLVHSSGAKPTLVYVRRDVLASDVPAGSLLLGALDERSHQLEEVELEFVDVAIVRHRAAWGCDPELLFNDDQLWLDRSRGIR